MNNRKKKRKKGCLFVYVLNLFPIVLNFKINKIIYILQDRTSFKVEAFFKFCKYDISHDLQGIIRI